LGKLSVLGLDDGAITFPHQVLTTAGHGPKKKKMHNYLVGIKNVFSKKTRLGQKKTRKKRNTFFLLAHPGEVCMDLGQLPSLPQPGMADFN